MHDDSQAHDHGHADDHAHGHQLSPEDTLLAFREAKDEFMRDDPDSPLADEQRESFAGLDYYSYNPSLRVETTLDRDVSAEAVMMQTSTGAQQAYRRAGKIHFEAGGREVELTIYQGPSGDLFLPLRDATSGKETYGAGRYAEPEMVGAGRVLVDFNYLYNPYCAYNDAWSCPLPPVENWLRVPIEAGEKNFPGGH